MAPPDTQPEIYLAPLPIISTVIDLATINSQDRQQRQQRRRQQQQQQQQQQDSPVATSLDLFSHLPSLESPLDPNTDARTQARAGDTNISNNKRRSKTPAKGPNEKKDCPRHSEGHPPNTLTTRELDNKRVLYLFFGSDVVLFDTIMAYRIGNPDKRVEDVIDHFAEHQGADALTNIIYETQAFDMVLKYPIAEHLRKVPEEPPVLGLGPTLSDIEINSTTSSALARKEEKLEKQRQLDEQHQQQQQQPEIHLLQQQLDSVQPGDIDRDVEAGTAANPKDPKVEKEQKMERYRIRFKKALLKEGLIIEEEPSIDGEHMFVKMYAPFWRLCIEAQRLRYKVELSQIATTKEKEAADLAASKAKSQSWLYRYFWRFLQRADNVSLPLRPESLLFKASKLRQYSLAEKHRKWSDIVRHGGGIKPDGSGVGALMGSDGLDGFFGTGRRGNLAESIIIYSKLHTKRGDRHALKTVMDKKAYTDMFTLHDGSYKSKVQPIPNRRTQLFNSWVRSRHTQPLEEIRFYHGEKIALYFAWIGYYTKWLIPAAIVGFLYLIFGVLIFYTQEGRTAIDIFDNALTLPFALFMSVWSALFVEFWKRRSNVLTYEWNTFDFERRERARPEFRPTATRISPVTGKRELYYPRYRQLMSIVMSIVVVLISIAIVIVSVGSLMLFNVWLKNDPTDPRGNRLSSTVVSVITAVLNLVVIMALGTIYARLAKILTDNENHRRLTQYEDALIIKRFLFDFVNFYSALVYIGYFKDNIGHTLFDDPKLKDRCDGSCMPELTIQMAIVFVGKQFLNQIQELAVPQLQKWWNKKDELAEKAASLKGKYKDKSATMKPPQWAKDDILPVYDPQMFEEYRELVIQFGFCTLFVVAFPVAPIFALLNNVLEIRVDAYKLLTQHRRPISQAAQDIGSWGSILMLLTHVSVFTNAILIAFQSTWMNRNVFSKVLWVQNNPPPPEGIDFAMLAVQLLFIFIFEHVVFALKVAIANLVRDMPRTVKLAIERESYYTRLALDDEEPAMDEALEDLDDDSDESDNEDVIQRKFHNELHAEDTFSEKEGNADLDEADDSDEEENDAELEALIKAGGCGCPAHGDGTIGTVKGGFEGTWMNRFRPETQAALRRRQQRRRRRQNTNKE
ncbi:Anoctamin-7 [Mortierella polycephala]|uniref:Anoctamin-7 n=1 Tax=Mortierella polycephala TaxID=41804 RepID=A0A9P6PWX9_9FUNG|nr:Anoctamin-7 [Mortierella polycephala]